MIKCQVQTDQTHFDGEVNYLKINWFNTIAITIAYYTRNKILFFHFKRNDKAKTVSLKITDTKL